MMWARSRGRLAAAVLIWSSLGSVAVAQAQDDGDWNRLGDTLEGAVGLHYGKMSGHGLSFRVPLEWWLYAQVTGGIWHTADERQHNLGFELNYLLRQDRHVRLFLAAGAGYFYDRDRIDGPGGVDVYETDKEWNTGAGVGLEVLQGARWSWKVEAAFVHDGSSGDIKVSPHLGIYYYW